MVPVPSVKTVLWSALCSGYLLCTLKSERCVKIPRNRKQSQDLSLMWVS